MKAAGRTSGTFAWWLCRVVVVVLLVNLSRTLPRRGLTFKCVLANGNAMRCTLEVFGSCVQSQRGLYILSTYNINFSENTHIFSLL